MEKHKWILEVLTDLLDYAAANQLESVLPGIHSAAVAIGAGLKETSEDNVVEFPSRLSRRARDILRNATLNCSDSDAN